MNSTNHARLRQYAEVAGWAIALSAARAAAGAVLIGAIAACAPAEANRSATAPAAGVSRTADAFEYFPAQYVNQATEIGPQIQSF
jgi:hypothetical protein